MNIISITCETPFKLSPKQFAQCSKSSKSFAYISSQNIQSMMSGMHIYGDHVFHQHTAKFVEYVNQPMIEIHGIIENQPVIATVNKTLTHNQNMTAYCEKRETILDIFARHVATVYSNCNHVKFVVNSKDILIANEGDSSI